MSCPIWDRGCSYQDTDYTLVSRVDRFTAPEELKAVRSYRDPSWVGNDRLLVFNHGLLVKQGALSTVGGGEPGLQQWFDPPSGLPQIAQGEMTLQGDKLAALVGHSTLGLSEEYVYLYGVDGYPAEPEPKCYISDAAPPSGRFMQPTWAPDGTQFALTESDGIHVFSNIPDLRAANPDGGQITERLLVYGSEPGWGPADVPSGAPQTAPAGPRGGANTRPAAAGARGGAGTPPIADLVIARRQQGHAVRVSLRVSIAGSTVRVRLLGGARKHTLGSTVKRDAKRGRLTLRVPLNARGRTKLRRSRRLTLSAQVVGHAARRRSLVRALACDAPAVTTSPRRPASQCALNEGRIAGQLGGLQSFHGRHAPDVTGHTGNRDASRLARRVHGAPLPDRPAVP